MDFLKLGHWPAMSLALARIKAGSFTGNVPCDFTLKELLEEWRATEVTAYFAPIGSALPYRRD
ncbi:MAG: hypothetical protein ACYDAE_23020 [Steroidobacteraceae bacterium]